MHTMLIENKYVYKFFLYVIKIIPTILALLKVLGLIFNCLKIKSFLLTCFGGTSVIMLLILYLISFIFRFCGIHRLSLHYVTLVTALTIVDWYVGIPLSTDHLFTLYFNITGIFMIAWIIIWYKNRNNPKIDHIKQLCDKYADCGC